MDCGDSGGLRFDDDDDDDKVAMDFWLGFENPKRDGDMTVTIVWGKTTGRHAKNERRKKADLA